MDIRSLNIPSIHIPGTKLFSGFKFPPNFSNSTWFIIVFVLGMFLLSCMSNRCSPSTEYFEDPINQFQHTHFDGPMNANGCGSGSDCVCHKDSADPLNLSPFNSGIIERFDDNGRDFANKPWYSCKMKSNCLPGETDTGEYCVKDGCPAGMERGAGTGSEFCYPKCAPGYEADGGGRCYKVCPEGYLTQGDDCIRPKHTFNKDSIPCKGCAAPSLPIPRPQIPIILEDGPGPVMMNPMAGGWPSAKMVQTQVQHPTTHRHRTLADNRRITHGHGATTTLTYPSNGGIIPAMLEPFSANKSMPQLMHTDAGIDPSQTNSVQLIEQMANENQSSRKTVPTCKGEECKKPKSGLVWRVEDRIHIDELPCPLGYTLSGDLCHENCPPNYRDTGDDCVLDRYSVDRPSYDRGSGIPFAVKRSKYQNINPISQCN